MWTTGYYITDAMQACIGPKWSHRNAHQVTVIDSHAIDRSPYPNTLLINVRIRPWQRNTGARNKEEQEVILALVLASLSHRGKPSDRVSRV